MADEVQILTINAAGTAWVDNVPSQVSTGYQNQNTGIEASWNGYDYSSAYISGSNLIIPESGLIDINGSPFVVKSQITLTLPTSGDNHFLRVISGSSSTEKSIEFTTSRGTYDAAKNAYYDGSGNRVLNWVYNYPANELNKISGFKDNIKLGSFLEIQGSSSGLPTTLPPSWGKFQYWNTPTVDRLGEFSGNRFTAKENNFFQINTNMQFVTMGIGEQYGLEIQKNGTPISRRFKQANNTVGNRVLHVSGATYMTVGDYIEIFVYMQTSRNIGGTYSVLSISSPKELF